MKTIGLWVLTLLHFMVYVPIIFIIQALMTPIELIVNFIKFGRDFTPDIYWYYMSIALNEVKNTWDHIGDKL